MTKILSTFGLALALGGLASIDATATDASATPTIHETMKQMDPDADGTIDLAEALKAGARHFAAFDKDHDSTLDPKEAAAAGVTKAEFRKAEQDKDGTLDLKEFSTIVKARFEAANPDHDGTVSEAELATAKGKALLALLR
jgi:Ca2+-binding EF-hand superfamily protein